MRRTVILSGVASFVTAFLGTSLALTFARPTVVGAQDTRIQAEQFTIVGENGVDRVRLETGPGLRSGAVVLDAAGTPRAALATGGAGAGNPAVAGLTIYGSTGRQIVRLGTARPPGQAAPGENNILDGTLVLFDTEERERVRLGVAQDGIASIQLLDANGNVTWSAR